MNIIIVHTEYVKIPAFAAEYKAEIIYHKKLKYYYVHCVRVFEREENEETLDYTMTFSKALLTKNLSPENTKQVIDIFNKEKDLSFTPEMEELLTEE